MMMMIIIIFTAHVGILVYPILVLHAWVTDADGGIMVLLVW